MKTDTIAKINPELMERVGVLLKDRKDAIEFLQKYRTYVHLIDDIEDGDVENNSDTRSHLNLIAKEVFSCDFWRQNAHLLHVLETVINNSYADSLLWEKGTCPILKRDAAVLRHAGIDMFFAVIYICAGRDALRSISADFREQCHKLHVSTQGEMV